MFRIYIVLYIVCVSNGAEHEAIPIYGNKMYMYKLENLTRSVAGFSLERYVYKGEWDQRRLSKHLAKLL